MEGKVAGRYLVTVTGTSKNQNLHKEDRSYR
jgi:hypothetical protein